MYIYMLYIYIPVHMYINVYIWLVCLFEELHLTPPYSTLTENGEK